ncbi:MAG TPA: hypothetical protein VK616_06625 [Flavitalea sp.]|nr:hypothetical protein [Flavitalea sp.]HTF31584.1 hypothetical protein [Flavitalea sp.]
MTFKNIAVSCCLVFICFPIYSQKIDSLKALLKIKTHLDRADVLYELSYYYIEVDNSIALKYGLEGYEISVKFNDSLRIVRTGLITASALRRLQKIDSAIVIYSSILGIA